MAGVTTRQETFGQAIGSDGITLNGSSQTLISANPSRSVLEISNGSDDPISLNFTNGTAVVGKGTILPPHSSGYWPTTGAVKVIGTSGDVVGYTEW